MMMHIYINNKSKEEIVCALKSLAESFEANKSPAMVRDGKGKVLGRITYLRTRVTNEGRHK